MDAYTKQALAQYLREQDEDYHLDEEEFYAACEESEDLVWGIFEDFAEGNWEEAELKLLRLPKEKHNE